MRRFREAAVLCLVGGVAIACGDDSAPPSGSHGKGGTGGAAYGGHGGSSGGSHSSAGGGAAGANATAGSSSGHPAAGQGQGGAETGGSSSATGGSGAQPDGEGGAEQAGNSAGGEAEDGGVAGTGAAAGTAGSASASGGNAGLGGSAGWSGSGGTAGGDAGTSSSAGTNAAGGLAGMSGSAGTTGGGLAGMSGSAGTGGAGGHGECSTAADCVAAYGSRGCGVWECSSAGKCEVGFRCDDADQDGFWAGADCECGGKALDCDDGDPQVGNTASSPCCDGGTRSCAGGLWGICSTRGGETCNGEDDDCDGVVDNLPEVSCGLGACHITVPSCTGNAPTACVPPAPTTTVDGCNGIDDDCDGAVDEDCGACIHVAPDGDDSLASSSNGSTPFATLQAAIDFADAHRALAHQVCVAAGAACGATATYVGSASADLTMRDGIGVLGNYESTTWTRCNGSVTTLQPKTARGIVFPANIALTTALDGFTVVYGFDASAAATGVTVDGAQGAVLSNLVVSGPTSPYVVITGEGIGVDVSHGASATIAQSSIQAHVSAGYTAAVRSVGAKVLLEDNCAGPFEAATGRCLGSCAISGFQAVGADEDAIALIDSPGSRVERSSVCANSSGNWYGYPRAMRAVRVSGASAGIVVRASTLTEYSYQDSGNPQPPERAVVSLAECAGAAPWLADNAAIALTTIHTDGDGVLATGDCHPVIEGNVTVSARQLYAANTRGIQCRAGTVASRCTVAGNDFSNTGNANYGIHGAIVDFLQSTTVGSTTVNVYGTGVLCQGSSCREIRGNLVIGEDNKGNCQSKCNLFGTGLSLATGSVDVRDNTIASGDKAVAQTFTPYAINGATTGNITGNLLSNLVVTKASLFGDNTSDTNVLWNGDGGLVRHNCFKSSGATAPFADAGTGHGPQEFTNNHLQATTVLYADGSNNLISIDQVNALTDMVSSGNDTHCP